MAEEKQEPDQIEVNVPVVQTGTVKFLSKSAFSNPAPDKLKRVLTAVRYTLVGMITATAGTDLFTAIQIKWICFVLGICVLICGGIELGTGVKPMPQEEGK